MKTKVKLLNKAGESIICDADHISRRGCKVIVRIALSPQTAKNVLIGPTGQTVHIGKVHKHKPIKMWRKPTPTVRRGALPRRRYRA